MSDQKHESQSISADEVDDTLLNNIFDTEIKYATPLGEVL